jgi:hypothetical protein
MIHCSSTEIGNFEEISGIGEAVVVGAVEEEVTFAKEVVPKSPSD